MELVFWSVRKIAKSDY